MHSTETALLKVQNDLLRNLDDVKTTVLVLLDLSAAFDTLDHSGVISLLEDWYVISGNALRCLPHIWWIDSKWFKLKNVWLNLSKQSIVFPRDLSLGRSLSHSIQHLLVK